MRFAVCGILIIAIFGYHPLALAEASSGSAETNLKIKKTKNAQAKKIAVQKKKIQQLNKKRSPQLTKLEAKKKQLRQKKMLAITKKRDPKLEKLRQKKIKFAEEKMRKLTSFGNQ